MKPTRRIDIHPIRSDRDHRRAVQQIETLGGARRGSPEAAKLERLATLAAAAMAAALIAYAIWAARFIRSTLVPLGDGTRAACLFDDAMISMRYAWNFVHGNGLVWNPGERVEGFTNPLMVAVMAVASSLFDRRAAGLAIQCFCRATVVANA